MKGVAIVLASLVAVPGTAMAFSIGTSVTQRCHERITGKAIARSNVDKPAGWPRDWPDQDESWVKIAHWLEEEGLIESKDDDRWRLFQVSMFLGSRYPDQRGFGITDLQGMREIHLSGDVQQVHSLRAPDQDGDTGNAEALASTRQLIRDLVGQARSPVDPWSMAGHMKTVSAWAEFYGDVDVVVWEPAFAVAKALHALQDTFSHTYRSPDLSRVHAVCNYVEALSGHHDERRDGPRHSTLTDDCDHPDVEPLKDAAVLASTELFNASLEYMNGADLSVVDAVLDKWLTLESGCGYEAGYCGTPWAAVAKREETQPFGCSVLPSGHPSLPGLLLVLALGLMRRRPATARARRR